jgi:hypothetical protein
VLLLNIRSGSSTSVFSSALLSVFCFSKDSFLIVLHFEDLKSVGVPEQ